MKKSQAKFRVLASLVFLLVVTPGAQAQAFETWVAGDGNDANPCTRDLPCQTLSRAINQTAAGGEINAKNAGEFGTLTITKSITIDGGGTFSAIDANPFHGIIVDDSTSATPNTAVVTLRNLSINGAGPALGLNGVFFLNGKTLNIENCQIFNLETGVRVLSDVSGGAVNIKNTSIFSATSGVVVSTTSGFVTVSFNGCNIEQNTLAGVTLTTGGHASIRDSFIHFNGVGVQMTSTSNTVNIFGSQINHNATGLLAKGTATIGSSTFMSNVTNFTNLGTIQTFGNNQTETNPIPGVVTNLGLR